MTVNRHCTCKSQVQIPLNLTGEAGDLYYNSTGCPSSFDTPSLFTSSSIISHPQTPYHTLPPFSLPRELCSFLSSNNTLLPLRNLSNSESKLSFIHISYISHSYYLSCQEKEESGNKIYVCTLISIYVLLTLNTN